MTKTDPSTRSLYNSISDLLEVWPLEELLEEFDITPEQIIIHAYDSGLIDPERFGELLGINLEGDENEVD